MDFQITTIPQTWSSWLERADVESALSEAGIKYEDVYPTKRPGVWQLESFESADSLRRRIDGSAELSIFQVCPDELDGEAYTIVMFRYCTPEHPDDAKFNHLADALFEERGNR